MKLKTLKDIAKRDKHNIAVKECKEEIKQSMLEYIYEFHRYRSNILLSDYNYFFGQIDFIKHYTNFKEKKNVSKKEYKE